MSKLPKINIVIPESGDTKIGDANKIMGMPKPKKKKSK